MLIDTTVCFVSFIIIEVLLCFLLFVLFQFLGRLPSEHERRKKSPYVIVLLLFIIALGFVYVRWNPSRLLIVEECEKDNPIYHKYLIISDYTTKEGLLISSVSGYYYIYNCSNCNLIFSEYTYGYRGGVRHIIRPNTFMSVSALPDFLFTRQPPAPIIRTTKYNNRLTRFYLDFERGKNDND